MLTKEQKDDELVKSLLSGGFDEETVESWIASGTITLEKSVQDGPDDHGEGDGDGEGEKKAKKGTEKREKEDKEEKEAEKGEEKREGEFEKGCGEKKDEIAKSLGVDELLKSIEDGLMQRQNETKEELMKSIPSIVNEALTPVLDKIEKSLSGMRDAIVAFGNTAPSFKGANLSKAIIEKSIENGGGAKDEAGKMALSITKDRMVVRELILKSIDEESDAELQKSLKENTQAYLLDPVEGAIGEAAAMYLYTKKNVRLVQ